MVFCRSVFADDANAATAPAQTPAYSISKRASNHRVWEKVATNTNSLGRVINHTNIYTELATGVCHWNGNAWIDSSDQIELTETGAAATNGQHQVSFSANINTSVAVDLLTPDGKHLQSHVLGLAYFDSANSNSVMFAELHDRIGQLLPSSNQVIYTNAFTDVQADVRYTYRKSGFEQDIILRQQPPSPAQFGLNAQSTRLQIWTEFVNPPEPVVTTNLITVPVPGQRVQDRAHLIDSKLDFGIMKFVHGNASSLVDATNTGRLIPVAKRWVQLEGRTFLIEEVYLNSVTAQLQTLPATATNHTNSSTGAGGQGASLHFKLPARKQQAKATQPMQLARADMEKQSGFLLDYRTINSSFTDFTFQADTTYYVSDVVDLYGTTTIEGGTVIKFDASSFPYLDVFGPINCLTGPYRPAVFSSMNNDAAGEIISGSSGDWYYPSTMLKLDQSDDEYLTGLRFYSGNGLITFDSLTSLNIRDCQFVDGWSCIVPHATDCGINLFNVLFAGNNSVVHCQGEPLSVTAENVTLDNGPMVNMGDEDGVPTSLTLINCLFYDGWGELSSQEYDITNSGGTFSATATYETASIPFQQVGAGTYYLAPNTYQGLGTTSIDGGLLADIQTKTTCPPIVYSNLTITSPLILSPQIPRDTNSNPDIGYHYDAVDYAIGGLLASNDVSVYPGTVVALFGTTNINSSSYGSTGWGLNVGPNVNFLCKGLATNWNRLVAFSTVQEQPGVWLTPTNGMILDPFPSSLTTAAEINCRFTDWSIMAMDAPHIVIASDTPLFLRDCQFHGGSSLLNYAVPTISDPSLNNCLFERVSTSLRVSDGITALVQDNLFFGGTFNFLPVTADAIVQNNLFDQTTIPDNSATSGTYLGGWNAYVTNCDQLQPASTNDLILASEPVYQTGPFGRYYLPDDSLLINAGSTNADTLGLYDYTVLTDIEDGQEIKETNSIVDIGYHYVATDSSGILLSTYTNGLADYLITSSVGAIPDWWEFSYFGNLDQQTNADYDNNGTNNLQAYLTNSDPNIISFSIVVSNQYVTTNVVSVNIGVISGVPASVAVLVDSTNFTSATWTPYSSSNLTVTLGTNQGPHDLWVGLKGLATNAQVTWDETTLVLDSITPTITITSPTNNVSFNASRVNVSGNFVAGQLQQITVNGVLAFTNGTNFEALNVPLSGGTNGVTAIVQDYNGGTNTASISVIALTNMDGSLNDPVQLTAAPVGGFSPLSVTFTAVNNAPGIIAHVYYDFNGDNIADFSTNNTTSFTHLYTTNQYFPFVTMETSSGRFSSIGSASNESQVLRINVLGPPTQISSISVTDPVDIKLATSSNLYVLSGSTATITEFDTNGTTVRSLGSIGSNPSGLSVDAAGYVYVALTGSNQVWRYYPTNSTFAVDSSFGINGCIGNTNGSSGMGTGQFNAPYGVAISPDGGTISVSDSGNNRIQQFDTNGAFVTAFGTSGSAIGQFSSPAGLTYDGTGRLYIADSGNNRVAVAVSAQVVGVSGGSGSNLLQFNNPLNVGVGTRGIYVADTGNSRIQSFDPLVNGANSFLTSDIRFGFSTNFSGPLAVVPVDNLTNEMFYIADTNNNQVRLFKLPTDDPMPAWNTMTNQMVSGNVSGAISNFCLDTSEQYRQAFLSIGTNGIIKDIGQMGTLTPVFIRNDTAEYYFQKDIEGHTILFPVEFQKESGVWKIVSF